MTSGSANNTTSKTQSDYFRAKWDPIHFKPAIDSASNADCLACHQEVLDREVNEKSPAGLKADDVLAWYQTLDTYKGDQDTFHRRHLEGSYAKKVMNLKCNTCHQGNDPREETANSAADSRSDLTMRKAVKPEVCLVCHGTFNNTIMGIPGSWPENAKLFNNSCLMCHVAIRTNRHQVNFLKPEAIETAGKESADACYGCHGGRAWYRINYPYPRHAWPGGGDVVPEWAKDRPTESEARFTVGVKKPAAK